MFFGGRFLDTPVLARSRLPAGAPQAGPAIVEEEGATTVAPPGWRLRVLDSGRPADGENRIAHVDGGLCIAFGNVGDLGPERPCG